MAKPTYWELLKHPNWQKKRLEVLQRENFTCESCEDKESPLHIHHTYYERGLAPWEYPDESLHCLCESCHSRAQELMTMLHQKIGQLALWEIDMLIVCAMGMMLRNGSSRKETIPLGQSSHSIAEGIAEFFGTNARVVMEAMNSKGEVSSATLYEIAQRVNAGTFDDFIREPE